MPTPTGLPKRGEVWELTVPALGVIPAGWKPTPIRCVVLERGTGSYWPLRVYVPGRGGTQWVDSSYWLSKGWLRHIGPAGPDTKARLGL